MEGKLQHIALKQEKQFMCKETFIEFGENQAYKLATVTDLNGMDKVCSRSLYENRINCVAVDFEREMISAHDEKYRMRIVFIQNEDGLWCKRELLTSIVERVEKCNAEIKVYTHNSIYRFEETELKKVPYLDTVHLIELYLSLEDNDYFGRGFYYDEEKRPHELVKHVCRGLFQDSVHIGLKEDDALQGVMCRYFPRREAIEFYDTLYERQNAAIPMVIHNTGKKDLKIGFQMYPYIWIISPGQKKVIMRTKQTREKNEDGAKD